MKIIPWRIREENSTKSKKSLWSKLSSTLNALEPRVQGTQNRARILVEPPKEWSRRGYSREIQEEGTSVAVVSGSAA